MPRDPIAAALADLVTNAVVGGTKLALERNVPGLARANAIEVLRLELEASTPTQRRLILEQIAAMCAGFLPKRVEAHVIDVKATR